ARLAVLRGVLCCCDENDTRSRDLLAKAVEASPSSPAWRLLLSGEETDRNRALAQALEARRLAPGAALPAYALSRFYGPPRPISWGGWSWFGSADEAATQEEYAKIREVEMPAKERALLEEALASRPGFPEAMLALAAFWFRQAGGDPREPEGADLGRPHALEAKKRLEEALAAVPGESRARRMLDGFADPGPEAEAASARRRLEEDFTDAEARARAVRALLALGRLEEAVGLLGDRLRLNPFDSGALRETAAAYRARDAADRAAGRLALALALSPESVDLLVETGDARLASGDRDGAVEAFRRALAIRPQAAELEARLRRLGPSEGEFYAAFRADLAPIVRKALADRPEEKTSAVVYFKNEVVRVLPNGTSKNFHQKVVKILTLKGAEDHRWLSPFPGRRDYYAASRGEVLQARVFRADGSSEEGAFREGGSQASFANLREGDVIAFEAKVEEVGEPRFKGYFGLVLLFQDAFVPVRESRATFLNPREKPLHVHAPGAPDPATAAAPGGLEARTWTMRGIPEVPEEYRMPGALELCPSLHASTFRTWEEVGDWFSSLVKDQLESSEEIRRAVAEATRGLRTTEEKVDALFRLLVSEIRYESLDLADHAYRPFKARQTFDRRYGDCKDTAALLHVMLREAGIDSSIVLIRAGESERIDIALPSMRIFNHAIAFVPGVGKDGLFLDATARYCGSRELPDMDQGAVAFVVGLGGSGKALVTPYDPPEANRARTRVAARLAADGSASLDLDLAVRGQEAFGWRSEFQKGVDRERELEKRLNFAYKSARLEEARFSDLGDYNRPVEVRARFAVPGLARAQGEDRALRPLLEPLRLCERWAPTATRHHDLVIGPPLQQEWSAEIALPAGWKAKSLPRGLDREDETAAYRLEVRGEPGKVTVRRLFERRAARVPKDRYAAFRAFCEEVDRAEDEELVLARE
ncbi:MAG: DUF3857 domain-containing protein, partial [Planctomycetes bacterium]|nr:DUF3857 domain-containing protein [Planctomycetota bacterium]